MSVGAGLAPHTEEAEGIVDTVVGVETTDVLVVFEPFHPIYVTRVYAISSPLRT